MPYKEKEIEKVYYTIGEVAKMFNVKPSLIRFWEKEFSIIKPQKNKKGNRLFTQGDIDKFNMIYHLVKVKGYTLVGAKVKLLENKDELEENMKIVHSLEKIKGFLLELKSELK